MKTENATRWKCTAPLPFGGAGGMLVYVNAPTEQEAKERAAAMRDCAVADIEKAEPEKEPQS